MSGGAAGRGFSLSWLQGLACGALLTFATPSALLAAALLAPAAVAALADRAPGRPTVRPVLLASLAFTFRPLWHLWIGGQAMALALDLLADPAVLLPAWLAGACGWALCQLLPPMLQAGWAWRERAREEALRAELAALEAEWDVT